MPFLDVNTHEFHHSARYKSKENKLHANILNLHIIFEATVVAQISLENICLVWSLVHSI
jgi:hypothetical protein